jgi:hypothetical protein
MRNGSVITDLDPDPEGQLIKDHLLRIHNTDYYTGTVPAYRHRISITLD